MPKKLYRSDTNRMISGICGGLGEYFGMDPTLVRLLVILGFFASYGTAIVIYIIAWIIIPDRMTSGESIPEPDTTQPPPIPRSTSWALLPGMVLIGLGGMLLIREYFFWFSMGEIWPLLLIGAGLILVFHRGTKFSNSSEPTWQNGTFSSMNNNGPATGENGGGI